MVYTNKIFILQPICSKPKKLPLNMIYKMAELKQ